tara:strand:+ start:2093 stop:2590 length:498 start_codon:yes stop_codon:yes gene_type:complete
MFLRTKIIKGNTYLYAIENKWYKRKKASRQRTTKYLGKCIKLEQKDRFPFEKEKTYFKLTPYKKIIEDLVIHELKNHGINKNSRHFNHSPKFRLNPYLTPAINFELNEGFLCNYTLNKAYNFKFKSTSLKDRAKELANILLQTGINIDDILFVKLYQKLSPEQKP